MQVSDPAFCLLTSVTKLPRRRKLTCDGPASLLIFRANWLIKDDHFFAATTSSFLCIQVVHERLLSEKRCLGLHRYLPKLCRAWRGNSMP
jgi:hypothetical protein